MTCNREHHDLLVLRPWLASYSGGDAYAHFDGLPMRAAVGAPRRYADLDVLQRGDDGRRTLHLDGFRVGCQIDDRHAEAYAWNWGYRPEHREAFGAADLARHGPSIAAIERGLDRLHGSDGPAETVGRFVVRLARVLKLDGIALLDTSETSSFRTELGVRRCFAPAAYGDAMRTIDGLVLELHQACGRRAGRIAA